MRFVPLHVSYRSPVRRLASSGGGGGCLVPFPACLAQGSVPPRGRACVSGAVQRRAGGGVGGVCVPPSPGGVVGRPRGAGGRGSLCLGPSLYLPWAGTKAGFFCITQSMEGVVSILPWFVSVRCRPDAVRGVPLRAGAGLPACRGHCGSGLVTVLGARGAWAQWRFSLGAAALSGGGGGGGGSPGPVGGYSANVPWPASSDPRAGGGGGREGGGSRQGFPSAPFRPLVNLPGSCGGWLEGPGPDPPYGRLCAAARPPLQRARPGLIDVPVRRARAQGVSCWQVSPCRHARPCAVQVAGGRGVFVPPSLKGVLGGPEEPESGGRSASVRPSASLGRAPKQASLASLSPWKVWSAYCSGWCPCAAARMQSAGCPCALAQDCRPVEVSVGVGG